MRVVFVGLSLGGVTRHESERLGLYSFRLILSRDHIGGSLIFFVAYLYINRVLGVPHDLASYAMGLPRPESMNGSEDLVVLWIGSGRSENLLVGITQF